MSPASRSRAGVPDGAPGPGDRIHRRAMRRGLYVLAPVVLVVLVLLASLGAQLRSGAPGGQSAKIGTGSTVGQSVPTLLLAHTNPAGRVDLAAVAGVARNGRDASILLIPTLTAAETPSFDPQLVA